ncbi:hypothetical protein Pint_05966 [Pistacia integerrima]|uniref:Uncharacterized protein n=1 Tax=Pistacia integerrima TaxID=434235 RepID=A0ACC0Z1H9_9ROSI|nr:hypothetical protein Pint_05966 [Pistacia integerrima]
MDRNSVKANTKTIKSRIGVYNARIERLLRLGKNVEEAKALYDEMLSRGMNPSSQTYRLLIHVFQEAGNVQEAVRLSNSMFKNQQDAYIKR